LPPEPLVAMGRGRSPFRVDDLLQLVELMQRIAGQPVKGGTAYV